MLDFNSDEKQKRTGSFLWWAFSVGSLLHLVFASGILPAVGRVLPHTDVSFRPPPSFLTQVFVPSSFVLLLAPSYTGIENPQKQCHFPVTSCDHKATC